MALADEINDAVYTRLKISLEQNVHISIGDIAAQVVIDILRDPVVIHEVVVHTLDTSIALKREEVVASFEALICTLGGTDAR